MAMARREHTTINTLFNRNEVMFSELQRFSMVLPCDGVHCERSLDRHLKLAAVCVLTAGNRATDGDGDSCRCPSA